MMFFIEQRIIYIEMNEKLKEEANLETITLTKEEAAQYLIDDGKELNINGRLYDIARIEDKGDKISYFCINDENEEHLFAKLEVFFDYKNKNNSDGKMELQLVKFLTLVTIAPESQNTIKTEILLSSIIDLPDNFTSVNPIPDIQPPQLS